jgi:hypothetical protein
LADGSAGRIIGMVAIIALSMAVPAMANLGYMGYSSMALAVAQGGLAGAMASAAVMMAGNMVLNAIAPIKPESNQLSGYSGDLADSRSYTWDGIQNDARQGLSKAMIFGRIKCGGQIISEKTWFHGTAEYLDMLICPCLGKVSRFSGIQINDTDVSLYRNTGPVFRPGDDQQTPIDMFNRIYLQYSSAAKIPYDISTSAPAESVVFSTKSAATGIRITVTAPNGIYELVANTPTPHNVTFHVQYRETGTSGWSALPTVDPLFSTQHPFIHRSSGVFTGAANPYTLADTAAGFSSRITAASDFTLTVGGTTYYCTQVGTLTADAIAFNAYTDAGHTTPLGAAPANGAYYIGDASIAPYLGTMSLESVSAYESGSGGGGEGS